MLYSKIEGSGKPLIILHGFLGMSDNWKTLGFQYVTQGFQVHLLDLRNHGRSFHSNEFNYEVMVQDLLDYCRQNNLLKVYIIGHSMGGKVAMFFANAFPEIVEKLVVVDIGPKYYKPHHQEILAGLNAVDFSNQPTRQDVEVILNQFITDISTKQFLMKSLYWISNGQLAFRFNLKVFNNNIEEIGKALPQNAIVMVSTLFVKGGNSSYIKVKDFELIKYHFPNSSIETILNAGHWLHSENPKEFFEKTIIFLK